MVDGAASVIDKYEQIWCFGFKPSNSGSPNDGEIDQPGAFPAIDAELLKLSQWMKDKKGGLFGTGAQPARTSNPMIRGVLINERVGPNCGLSSTCFEVQPFLKEEGGGYSLQSSPSGATVRYGFFFFLSVGLSEKSSQARTTKPIATPVTASHVPSLSINS